MNDLDQVPEAPLTTPLDDQSLMLLREATLVSITGRDDDGNHTFSGDFTVNQLLEFWSGISEDSYRSLGVHPDPITGEQDVEWLECTRPMLSEHDIIRDLIDEIFRIRKEAAGDAP